MLIQCPECSNEVSDTAPSCPKCGHILIQSSQAAREPETSSAPIFTILAALALVLCLFTPRIILAMPAMATIACGVIGFFRKERWRWGGLVIAGLAIGITILSETQMSAPMSANLSAAQLVNYNWTPDATFGGHGTVKWNAEVKNVSDRPIASVKVDLTTYDASGHLLASSFTFVNAIPPGETRSTESFADYFGNEAKADAVISEVRFEGN